MGLHKIYSYLAESNRDIQKIYEQRNSENREDFEKHRIKYWIWLVKLNVDHRIFHIQKPGSGHIVGKKKSDSKAGQSRAGKVDHFELVRGIWQFHGATDELISTLKVFDQSFECWQRDNSLMWLIFIASLYERGDEKGAAAILDKYIDRYGLKDIDRFLLAAEFAHKMGKCSVKINRSYGIFSVLKNNHVEKKYEAYVKDKSIAVVGNGGGCIGQGKGAQIDAHDIVIRFNNYPVKGYEADYGSKTNVWIRAGNNEVGYRDIRDYDFVIYEPDFDHIFLHERQLDILGQYVTSCPDKLFYWNSELKRIFRKETKIINPSSGILAIWQLFKLRNNLEGVDLYGFSFQETEPDYKHYYDDLCKMALYHDVSKEKALIDRLLDHDKSARQPCRIFCCAYREYDVNSGKTGGPGGVLMMQKQYLGERFRNIPVEYIFKTGSGTISLDRTLNGTTGLIIQAARFITSHRKIRDCLEKGEEPLLVCHDIGCAYGAYLLGLKYVVVYHQQGSIINEIKALGRNYSEEDMEVIAFVEREVLKSAYKVYFPSLGSREVFERTSVIDRKEFAEINFSEYALYNTIREVRVRYDIEKVLEELNLSGLYHTNKQIFISVADFNYNKGMDRIPHFLSRYVSESRKDIVWIAIGYASNTEMFDKMDSEKDSWNFEAYLIGRRIDHQQILELCNWADFYIMLHRNSIFDLAVLEAMRAGTAVILSNAKSNYEFDRENNILIVDPDNVDPAIEQMLRKDLQEWKQKNRAVFNAYFSQERFAGNYIRMLGEFTRKCGYYKSVRSLMNQRYMTEWKDRYIGRKAVICGSGSSLESIREQDGQCVYIALNKALFYARIQFDILFMQDHPQNQKYRLEDYNSYDCLKFYGVITNPQMSGMGLYADPDKFRQLTNRLYRYELQPEVFDHKTDRFNISEPDAYFADGQSVLFSALQFAVLAGFQCIELCGVDFSGDNYGADRNMSVYARNVVNNLIAFKEQLKAEKPQISLCFLDTTNIKLAKRFYYIDHKKDEVIVSGVYTEDYGKMVRFQEETCEDDYRFDFRYVSDAQWNEQRGTGDFAFFGGNTIKTQLVIDKIREYWGKILIVADADLIFLQETKEDIVYDIKDVDMLFLRERGSGQAPYERAIANINIGFVAMKCNQASLDFWMQVQQETRSEKGWDQEIANIILHSGRTSLQYKMLPENFLNGGSITSENVGAQRICTACGTIAGRKGLSKFEFLLQAYNNAKMNRWFEGRLTP